MDNTIILTDKDIEMLYQAVPGDVVYSCTKQLLMEPALDEFTVKVNHSNSTVSEYAFVRMVEGCRIQKLCDMPSDLMPGTGIGCVTRSYSSNGLKLADCMFILGCNLESEPTLYALSPFYLHPSQPQGYEEVREYCESGSDLYTTLQYLLMHHKECLVFDVQRKSSTKHIKKKGRSKKKTITQTVRVYHLSPLDDETVKRIRRTASIQRRCPAWGVRGHYRHYQNGKVVYVKPHIKGKHKEQYSGREYVFVPREKTLKNEPK